MNISNRPLPYAIATMILLVGVKTAGMVHAIGIGSPAQASTTHEEQPGKPETAKPAAEGAKKGPAEPQSAKPVAAEPACPPPEPVMSDAERNTLQDLRGRSKELDTRAAKLDERESLVTATERSLDTRVQQLTALQTKLEQLEKERKERDEENWKGLVKTYEAMRPRDAAAIFNDLDNSVLIQVLDRMKEAKAAPILAAMTPDRARAATLDLAKWRNQVNAAPTLDGSAPSAPTPSAPAPAAQAQGAR